MKMDFNISNVKFRCIFLFLCLFLLPLEESMAFDPKSSVYVKDREEWNPAIYVGERSDCVSLERVRPYPFKAPFLKIPTDIPRDKIEVGDEILEELSDIERTNPNRLPIMDRVLSLRNRCHEVKDYAGSVSTYALPMDIIDSSEFLKLRGSKTEFLVGDKVYALVPGISSEIWALNEILEIRDDCFQIESAEKALCGNYLEDKYINDFEGLFSMPAPVKKTFKKGDSVEGFVVKNLLEGVSGRLAYSTLEGSVRVKTKGKLILNATSEDCMGGTVNISDLRVLPKELSLEHFLALKPGDVILEAVSPECCCCSLYYSPHKVTSQRSRGYLLKRVSSVSGGLESYVPSQLIPANGLN